MILALSAYVKNIALFLIFWSFISIVIPDRKYKDYINICLGFVLIFILIQPIGWLLNTNELFENAYESLNIKNFESSTLENLEEDINNAQTEQILIAYKERLSEQLKDFVDKKSTETGYVFLDSDFNIDQTDNGFSNILDINLTVIENLNEDSNENSNEYSNEEQATAKPFIRVEKVTVEPFLFKAVDNTDAEPTQIISLKNFISDFYNISVDNIHIRVQERLSD